MTRKPKPVRTSNHIIEGDAMSPRWPAGSSVMFDVYAMTDVDRWACGEDVYVTFADGAEFLRVASMTPGKSITLIALNPAPTDPTSTVVPWADVRSFGVAKHIVTPNAKGAIH